MKYQLLLVITCVSLFIMPAHPQSGSVISDKLHSPSLEQNLLGDSPDRDVSVYLPPGYEKQTKVRYPVVYLLHGATATNKVWVNTNRAWTWTIQEAMDKLIAEGKVRPMIIVMPDGNNKYGGGFYTNSAATGNWEDFITTELVKYIDAKYRTLPNVASRGIAGHSMGGYGAIKLAMKHPEIYGAVYGLSACCLGWDAAFLENKIWSEILSFKTPEDAAKASIGARLAFMRSAAWSSNPAKAPLFFDSLFTSEDGALKMVDDVFARWSANMPIAMADQYRPNLLRLRAIAFDIGKQDNLLGRNRMLTTVLKRNQIPHTFEEYEGDHTNRIPERVETRMLPFFSKTLEFSTKSSASLTKK